MLGDKAVLTVGTPGRSTDITVEVRVPGGTVHLDTSQAGVVSAVVRDRKGRERDRAVVSVGSLVFARLLLR